MHWGCERPGIVGALKKEYQSAVGPAFGSVLAGLEGIVNARAGCGEGVSQGNLFPLALQFELAF